MNKIILQDKYTFPQIVKGLSPNGKHEVFPINPYQNPNDSNIVSLLYKIIDTAIENKVGTVAAKSRAIRINDINDQVINYIVTNLVLNSDDNFVVNKLSMNSYADIKLDYFLNKYPYYIEVVCTTKYDIDGDSLRCIYLSSTLKNLGSSANAIMTDVDGGKHILMLLTFDIDDINNVFVPRKVRIYDLYNAKMNLKVEYSASLDDINKLEIL